MLVNWEKTSYKSTVFVNVFILVVLVLTVILTIWLGPQATTMMTLQTTPDTSTLGFWDLKWYNQLLVLFGYTLGFLVLFIIIGFSLYAYKATRIKWIPIVLCIFLGVIIVGLWYAYNLVKSEGIYYELLLRFSGWVSSLITFGAQNLLVMLLFVGIGLLIGRQVFRQWGIPI